MQLVCDCTVWFVTQVSLRKHSETPQRGCQVGLNASRHVPSRIAALNFSHLQLPIKMRRSSRTGPSQSQGPAQSQTQRPRNSRNQMDLVSEEEGEEQHTGEEDEEDGDDVQVEGTSVSFESLLIFFNLGA